MRKRWARVGRRGNVLRLRVEWLEDRRLLSGLFSAGPQLLHGWQAEHGAAPAAVQGPHGEEAARGDGAGPSFRGEDQGESDYGRSRAGPESPAEVHGRPADDASGPRRADRGEGDQGDGPDAAEAPSQTHGRREGGGQGYSPAGDWAGEKSPGHGHKGSGWQGESQAGGSSEDQSQGWYAGSAGAPDSRGADEPAGDSSSSSSDASPKGHSNGHSGGRLASGDTGGDEGENGGPGQSFTPVSPRRAASRQAAAQEVVVIVIAPSPAPEGDGGAPAPEAALAAGDVAEAKPSPTSRPGTDTRDRTVQQEEFALATDAGARPVRPDAAGARLLDRDAPAPTPRKHDEFVFLDADAARGLPAFWFVDGGPAGWVPRNAYIGGAGEEATFEFEIPDPDPVGAAEGPGAAGSGELALGPLASFQPEAAALDLGLQQFLDRLGDLGRELGRSLEKGGVMPWLAALTVAAAALEVSRRRKGRQLPRVALAGGDEESTLTWAAGLPGPPASEES